MTHPTLISGDIALTNSSQVLVVISTASNSVTGRIYLPQISPTERGDLGEEVTIKTEHLTPISDLQAAWISPARLAFETASVEEAQIREAALRAAQKVGDGAKVVVTTTLTSTSIVAVGTDGQCIALAYSKKQPPFIAIRDVVLATNTKLATDGFEPAGEAAMGEWILSGSLGEKPLAHSDETLLAQLFQDMKSKPARREEERRWFDLVKREPDQKRVAKWLAMNWRQSAEIKELLEKRRSSTREEMHAVQINGLEDLCFLYQSKTAAQRALEVISSYEDYLFDLDLEPEHEIEAPLPKAAPVGSERLEYVTFHLPQVEGKSADILAQYLVTTASHGFLEVEDPLILDSDVAMFNDLVDQRSGKQLIAIDGPGGSGKTTTLMRIASVEAAAGRKVAFVVCSVSLKNRLRRIQRRVPGIGRFRKPFPIFSADAITEGDDNDLNRTDASRAASAGMYKPGGGLGLSAEKTLEPALKSEVIGSKRPFLIAAHQIKAIVTVGAANYDSLFIDEAQDLYPQHWLLAFSLIAEADPRPTKKGGMRIPTNATAHVAFDERQNILERKSILDPFVIQFQPGGEIKVATSQEKLQKYALSFDEAKSLASAIDERFAKSASLKWIRSKEVVRQTDSLADHAAKVIQKFEVSHPELYGSVWGGLGLSSKKDRVADPINVIHPTGIDDLVSAIETQDRLAKRDGTLQLAVALPISWGLNPPSRWLAGDLTLRLIASGTTNARTPSLAIGRASTVLRKAIQSAAATGVVESDFSIERSTCGRIEFLVPQDNRRGNRSSQYKKVLMRVVMDAVLLRQNGPSHIILADPYTLKGFEFGTLLDLTGDISLDATKSTYTLATRPRWRLVTGDLSDVTTPAKSGYEQLCRTLMGLLSADTLPVITPEGVRDLQRGEQAAVELSEAIGATQIR